MLVKVFVVACAMLFSCAAAVTQETPPLNCRQLENIISGQSWFGVVVCDEGGSIPYPTAAEWKEIETCLQSNGVEYDIGRMAGWRLLWAKDLIKYPTDPNRITVGYTTEAERTIFVRSTIPLMYGEKRGLVGIRRTLMHEIIHVILLDPMSTHHPKNGKTHKAFKKCDPDW